MHGRYYIKVLFSKETQSYAVSKIQYKKIVRTIFRKKKFMLYFKTFNLVHVLSKRKLNQYFLLFFYSN